ncbi:hypothetical protein [Jiella sonneratiae]|uniref:Uncharacterized protein n=1 Tax=Jiella sonneratiae TaxID=2816856 RepID=A0ABS3IXF1_9HYPH|nr:hypothetical protein [Jiella sonneratiae]MBO0902091.1 hypothetical protein [Jiella sonneratiae]
MTSRIARTSCATLALALAFCLGTGTALAFDLYEHNGSLVRLTERNGLVTISYQNPKSSLRKLGVRNGTVLFTGRFKGRGLAGTAYVFRKGCQPAPYDVAGPATGGGSIYLSGAAPVRARGSCAVTGYSERSGNARLVFDAFQGDD